MKKTHKLLILLLCLLMVVSVAGCGSKAPTATQTPAAAQSPKAEKTKLDEILEKGYIVWGTNAEFMPFEYKDSSNKVVGVDADIAQAIADSLGVKLKVEDMAFDSLSAALESGKIDFIGAGFTKNDERLQAMDFSVEYYTAIQVVITKEGSKIASKDDLKGKKIGVQTGTTSDLFVASDIEGAKVERYTSLTLACQDLKNGRVDCVIGDNLPITMIQGQIKGLSIVKSIAYDEEKYGLAVDKGDTALLDKINTVLNKLISDGTIEDKLNLYSTEE